MDKRLEKIPDHHSAEAQPLPPKLRADVLAQLNRIMKAADQIRMKERFRFMPPDEVTKKLLKCSLNTIIEVSKMDSRLFDIATNICLCRAQCLIPLNEEDFRYTMYRFLPACDKANVLFKLHLKSSAHKEPFHLSPDVFRQTCPNLRHLTLEAFIIKVPPRESPSFPANLCCLRMIQCVFPDAKADWLNFDGYKDVFLSLHLEKCEGVNLFYVLSRLRIISTFEDLSVRESTFADPNKTTLDRIPQERWQLKEIDVTGCERDHMFYNIMMFFNSKGNIKLIAVEDEDVPPGQKKLR